MRRRELIGCCILVAGATLATAQAPPNQQHDAKYWDAQARGRARSEMPSDAYLPGSDQRSPGMHALRGGFLSVQVNVDANGDNIVGDAANEPSMAIDPTNPNRIAIGWRQFDTIASNFRQAGYGYSQDAGRSWTFPGVIDPGVFRSDPVLDFDAAGNFYYMNIYVDPGFSTFRCDMYISGDGGMSWAGQHNAFGGDKEWFVVDKTGGIGDGNMYHAWSTAGNNYYPNQFDHSSDGGVTWADLRELPQPRPIWGTLDVAANGDLYISGQSNGTFYVIKSTDAKLGGAPTWDFIHSVNLGGSISSGGGPNPGGLLGQCWLRVDRSTGPTAGNVYMLCSVDPPGSDPLDVMFARSTDGGSTWSAPVRVNDDPAGTNAYQWFGAMSVAPNGRIDVTWNDTRTSGADNISEVFYSYSTDGGVTWSANLIVSPQFNSWLGWPNQSKMGDYTEMISDNVGANLAYAATYNGEQDVYFMRIGLFDCNGNDVADPNDLASGYSTDLNGNGNPDECDCIADSDGDFDVDLTDLAALLSAFDTSVGEPGYDPGADANDDGVIDLTDLAILLARFELPCP